jgi:peptide chain release factor 1
LKKIETKYDEILEELSRPETLSNPEKYKKLAREQAEMSELVEKIKRYIKVLEDIEACEELMEREKEGGTESYLKSELNGLKKEREKLEEEIKILLLGKDPRDEKDVIMEIRAGAGGEEASLFAADLFRMYTRYAEKKGWKVEVLGSNESDMGGFKEVIFEIKGKGAFSKLKFESGVHRVQRIPVTESGGRIHTSTATVAVLPEAEEVEVKIDPNDLKIETFRASGPGGQHVNVTDSAVRITHLPTGMVVQCQEERSQIQNREKAMRILRARLYEKLTEEQTKKLAEERRQQVGTGDRSERVRTYNFPQNRVTDHRIGFTLHNLEEFLDGEIDEVIEALAAAERAERLRGIK